MIKKTIILIYLSFTGLTYLSGNSEVDSLRKALKDVVNNREKIEVLLQLAILELSNQPAESRKFVRQGISLCKKAGDRVLLAELWSILGSSFYYEGEWEKALNAYLKALNFSKKYNGQSDIARMNNNLGLGYMNTNNYTEAQKYFQASLRIRERINDEGGIISVLTNLGALHQNMKNNKKAEEYALKAYKRASASEDLKRLASATNNLGTLYYENGRKTKALQYFNEAVELNKKIGDNWSLATNYSNIGLIYTDFKNYQLAEKNLIQAIKLKKEIGDLSGTAAAQLNLGGLYGEMKKYQLAVTLLETSEKYFLESGDVEYLMNTHKTLVEVHTEMGNHKLALIYFKKYDDLRDTLFSEDQTKVITEMETKYESEKKEKELILQQRDLRLKNERLKTQEAAIESEKYFRNFVVVIALLILVVAGGIFYQFLNNKKINRIISLQKQVVEEKNKEILDSINYAKRIQYALLANEAIIQEQIPDHVVYFKPKDIVSGDFYWSTIKNDEFYLAACDSTGHGVPGAFMSLLNTSYLNEAVNEMNLSNPNEVFEHVKKRLVESISLGGAQDGMDGILIKGKKNGYYLEYAAANNAPVLIRNNEIVELPYDKLPVGKSDKEMKFKLNKLNLHPGDVFFMYTDGYADQFGGPKGKKFKYKNLNLLLAKLCLEAKNQPLISIFNELDKKFMSWKGDLEQVDDVCIIGVRV